MNVRFKLFLAAIKPWVLARLREPTTYVGLIIKIAAIYGLTVTDSSAAEAGELVAVVVGAMLVAYEQVPKPDDTDQAGA